MAVNYSGTVSGLQQAELQSSAMSRAAMENTLARLLQQIRDKQQGQRQDRQLDQQDAAMAQRGQQFQQSLARDDRAFDASRMDAASRRAYQQDDIDLRREALRVNESLRQEQERRMADKERVAFDYSNALEAADQGMYDPAMFPQLESHQQTYLKGRSDAVRRQIEGQMRAIEADAAVMNQDPEAYNRMIEAEKDRSWNAENNRWYNNSPDRDAIAEWQRDAANIRGAQAAVRGDRDRFGNLIATPQGTYRPAMTLPWRTTTTSAPPPEPAAQPSYAPPPAEDPTSPAAAMGLQERKRQALRALIASGMDPVQAARQVNQEFNSLPLRSFPPTTRTY